MTGDLLALGAVAVLAAAGVVRRGSRAELPAPVKEWQETTKYELVGWSDVPFTVGDFPAFTSFSRSSWGRGSDRYSEPHPSWRTAKAWVEERKSDPDRYGTRVDYSSKPSRSATTLYSPEWLLPNGNLADDIEIRRTLGGLILAYHDHRWDVASLPDKERRRIRTIYMARSQSKQAAIDALTDELCTVRATKPPARYEEYERQRLVEEIAWLHEQGRV